MGKGSLGHLRHLGQVGKLERVRSSRRLRRWGWTHSHLKKKERTESQFSKVCLTLSMSSSARLQTCMKVSGTLVDAQKRIYMREKQTHVSENGERTRINGMR